MPGELKKVRDKSYRKGERFLENVHPKKTGQKRTHTTIILLKIRVNHGMLFLIEVHPLEKTWLIPSKMELRNQETKAIAKEKGK